jgi:microcystin-dependent protein
MPLETAQFIHQLDAANPLGSDPIAAGDDHLRLIKAAIKATFPNITGPVTATQSTINSPFPVGGIIMWSGAVNAVPSGWSLCNGANGTPDLRNRFIVGAGSDYAVGATGGANEVTLTTNQIPGHTHSISASGTTDSQGFHGHSINDPGHVHVYGPNEMLPNKVNSGQISSDGVNYLGGYANTNSATTGISINGAGAHTHSVTVSGTSGSVGGGQAHENRPPYYALAYIMKLAY